MNAELSSTDKREIINVDKVIDDEDNGPDRAPASFEEAITATKFGKFNIMLALLAMLSSQCAVVDTTTMSYAFVAAQCDLDLSLGDKGLLNGCTYIGMISSAFVWGFFFDVLGRKKLLAIGFLVDAVFVFTSALSQDMTLLLISKFFQGFIINGPFAALSSYISEFHCAKYRPTFQLIISTCMSTGTAILPLIAWIILPQNLDFTVVKLNFHSWNVFLLVTGLPALLSGLIFVFCPESPKFLMTCGENDKALAIFKKVYRINTGLPEDTYPFNKLVEETKINESNNHNRQVTGQKTKSQTLQEGFRQIRPLFFPPHLHRIIFTSSIYFFLLMSFHMLRLWLPQIFQIMTDYQLAHHGSSASMCVMLETISSPNKTVQECTVNMDNSRVYINSAIIGLVSVFACSFVGLIIRFIGKKKILLVAESLATGCCILMYFARDPSVTLICSAIFIGSCSVCSSIMVSITIDLFPTTLRTLAISTGFMFGRIGVMVGNLIFPLLLQSGCESPFFVTASFILVAFLMSIFLPTTDMQVLT